MVFPGIDFSTFYRPDGLPDLDPNFTPIAGSRVVAETVARRLISPPGSFDDPQAGTDLTAYLGGTIQTTQLGAVEAAIRAEALQVDGVDDAAVRVVLDGSGGFVAAISLTLSDDDTYDFAFVLSADTVGRIFMPAAS